MKKILFQRLSLATGTFALAGVLAVPGMVGAVTGTADTTINAQINAAITISSSGTVTIPSLTPAGSAVTSSASDTVSVSTNNTAGYTLSLADKDATTSLTSGVNTIPAHSGTLVTPTALATNSWGFAVPGGAFDATYTALNNSTSATEKFAGVPASGAGVTLKTTATTSVSDPTTVWYGVKVDATKATGTYSDIVTYTAVTN